MEKNAKRRSISGLRSEKGSPTGQRVKKIPCNFVYLFSSVQHQAFSWQWGQAMDSIIRQAPKSLRETSVSIEKLWYYSVERIFIFIFSILSLLGLKDNHSYWKYATE